MILESKTIARSLLRKAKLTGVAHRIRMLWHRGDYEDRFSDALLGCIARRLCVGRRSECWLLHRAFIQARQPRHRVRAGSRELFSN